MKTDANSRMPSFILTHRRYQLISFVFSSILNNFFKFIFLVYCLRPCLNGGVCIKPNVCLCPKDYAGITCQFHGECQNFS